MQRKITTKKRARAIGFENSSLTGLLQEIATLVDSVGLPTEKDTIVESVRILVSHFTGADEVQRSSVPARHHSITTTDIHEFDDTSIEEEAAALDDPQLWEIDDIPVRSPPVARQQPTSPAPTRSHGGPDPIAQALLERSQKKLAELTAKAELEGITYGAPGARKPGSLLPQREKTPVSDQRAQLEKLTGRAQQAPPPGKPKPPM
jgi:hypothetical protein